jgi:hypothetical protein
VWCHGLSNNASLKVFDHVLFIVHRLVRCGERTCRVSRRLQYVVRCQDRILRHCYEVCVHCLYVPVRVRVWANTCNYRLQVDEIVYSGRLRIYSRSCRHNSAKEQQQELIDHHCQFAIMDGTKNYLGATIFWLYNAFALVFTGITLRTLYRLQQTHGTKKRNAGAIWLFSGLALVSFATLSTNMLNVLIQSFNTWSVDRSPEELANLPLSIWQWSITSSLFSDFGDAIVGDSARFFWVQSALLATLSIFYYMGSEGRQRGVPQLWSFFCLSQILPISFAQNLFYVALLLSPDTEGQLHFNKSRAVMSAGAYCLCLACAQMYTGTDKLILIILAARALLMAPFLLKTGRFAAAITSDKVPIDRATGDELQRIVLKSAIIMTGMKGYQAMQEGFSPQVIASALFSHPAVASLGCDFILSALSFAAWNYLAPRAASSKTAAVPPAAPTSSTRNKKDGKKVIASGRSR